jgi:hypothetical protein
MFIGPLFSTGHAADHIKTPLLLLERMPIGPLPRAGYGADHIENMSSNTLSSVVCAYFWAYLEMGLRVTVESEDLTAVIMKSSIFWDIAPCNPLKIKVGFE